MKSMRLFILMVCALMVHLECVTVQSSTSKIMTTVFGDIGVDVSPFQKQKIESLLHDIALAKPCQLYAIAQDVINELKLIRNTIEIQIHQQTEEKKIVSQKKFFTLFCLKHQINYLEQYKKNIFSKFSVLERLECSFERNFKRLKGWLQGTPDQKTNWQEIVVDRIIDYINFERENILFDYKNLLTFIVSIKKAPLPDSINFWADKKIQQKLIYRARTITPEVKVQQFEEIFMIALQSYIMAGGSMYTQWLDQADEEAFEQANAEQNKIQTDFQVYINQLNAAQKNITAQILKGFKTGMQNLFADYKTVNEQQQQEEVYLFKSINIDYPIQHALTLPPIPYDQVFQAGIMNTPASNQWYNIYQYGDWEFDAQRNSFWQNGLIPFGIPFWQATKSTNQSLISDPSQNSIFTEYISNDASYMIEIECNLVNCTYPFFVGVLFNRGRWISADPERLWQYRLYGLYGNQTDASDVATRSINLYFAQQILTTEDKQEKIVSPLEQITSLNKQQLYSLPKTDVALLVKDSITYVFTITTAPETVTLSFSKKGGPQLYSTTLQNLNSYLAIFGGIGFMAAGCQAEFRIIKPEKLIYSSDDIKNFTEAQQ